MLDKIKLCVGETVNSQFDGYFSEIRHIILWQCKSERSDRFFLGRDFAIRTVSVETVKSCVFFCFRKPANSKQAWCECHIINYLHVLT